MRTTVDLINKLDDIQKQGVSFLMETSRCVLSDSVGTGKTVMSCVFAELSTYKRILIIAPGSPLQKSWETHIKDWAPSFTSCVIYNNNRNVSGYAVKGLRTMVITTPGKVYSDLALIKKYRPDCIIIDEAHFLRSRSSRQSKAVVKLCNSIRKGVPVKMLTATPIVNGVADLFYILKIIHPDLHSNYRDWVFARTRFEEVRTGAFSNLNVIEFLDKEYKKVFVDPYFLSRESDKKPMPPIIEVVPIELHDEDRDYYNQARDTFLGEIAGKPVNVVDILGRLQTFRQIAISHSIYDDTTIELSGAKSEWVVDSIKKWPEDDKVIIFSDFSRPLKKLFNTLIFNSIPASLVTGEIDAVGKDAVIENFLESSVEHSKVLLITGRIGGASLNLQKANRIICLDYPWTGAMMRQWVGRIHRRGQLKPTFVYVLEAQDTIDSKMRQTCVRKLETLENFINIKKQVEGAVKTGYNALQNLI